MPLNQLCLCLSLKITKSEAEQQKIFIPMNFTFLTQTPVKCH
ncbi:hypothetical protein T4A_9393 [Trichinella pseudospiralis]|uniref:Uncharacterized protein n=1 Tax=Trichinella pseudospiralis TaxID=6337 RepID=A0A0V1DNV2_TRIPS|nr:hypothetical protein T4A_9393 [Trichinella pseudospiralis]